MATAVSLVSDLRVFESCFCPIKLEIMNDPVIDECGHTFERSAIVASFNTDRAAGRVFKCPMTNQTTGDRLVPNLALKDLIGILRKLDASGPTNVDVLRLQMIRVIETLTSIQQRMDVQDRVQEIKDRQIQNLYNMTPCDSIAIFMGLTSTKNIMNANISNVDLEYLEKVKSSKVSKNISNQN